MIKEAFTAAVGSVTNETGETRAETRTAYINLVASVLAFLLAIVILSFMGKFLWNSVIIELFMNNLASCLFSDLSENNPCC